MSKSQFMCARCGCAVYLWYGHGKQDDAVWKHAAGPGMKSCGKPPRVIKRAEYDASIKDMLDAAKDYEKRSRHGKTSD